MVDDETTLPLEMVQKTLSGRRPWEMLQEIESHQLKDYEVYWWSHDLAVIGLSHPKLDILLVVAEEALSWNLESVVHSLSIVMLEDVRNHYLQFIVACKASQTGMEHGAAIR